MKVCIIGDFSPYLDEGLKNIAHQIYENLFQSTGINLLKVNIKKIMNIGTVKSIFKFKPDVIHYIPGPTNKSFVLLKILYIFSQCKPKIVVSATHPMFSEFIFTLLDFKPDCILTSSLDLKNQLNNLGINCIIVPNGVDTNKFQPVSSLEKKKLRSKYGLDANKFTLLHVGHLTDKRNLAAFENLAHNFQTIIVASDYINVDSEIYHKLKNSGCYIFQGFFPEVEEFYQLSDCYLFPVKKGDSILLPLSILEAMSCNLPVITTRFEGINTFFQEGEGLIFVDDHCGFLNGIEMIKTKSLTINTREKVESFTWKAITQKMISIYNVSIGD
jgi:glycosyltransferase involved in cell wall biosynthesis